MSHRFILISECVHCFGRISNKEGIVNNENEAIKWVKEKTKPGNILDQQKNCDTYRCPVVGCPAKNQIPRYSYRKI